MKTKANNTGMSSAEAEQERRFIEVIEREEKTISSICFSYACSVAEYEDLRQDALINIWRGLAQFREQSSLKTWIYRVTLNSCVSTIRKQSRFGKESESLDNLYNLVGENPEERERIETLHSLVGTLGAEDKAIMLMWLDDASYEDISEVLGMSKNNVATRLHRIKEKLAKKYRDYECR